MRVRARDDRDDGRIDDGEALDADEPAPRIDHRRRIVRRAIRHDPTACTWSDTVAMSQRSSAAGSATSSDVVPWSSSVNVPLRP